jgi:hypothetical protein
MLWILTYRGSSTEKPYSYLKRQEVNPSEEM